MRLSQSILAALLLFTFATAKADEPARAPLSLSDGTSTSILSQVKSQVKAAGQRALDSTSHVTEFALGMLGIQYKFGGANPDNGFDCSGLVRYVFQQVTGISLPHNAAQQSREGSEVAINDLRPGDLVFFNTRKFSFSHVGIYLGDNKFVHAPKKGQPVQIVDFSAPYWQKAYDGARRMLESAPQVFTRSAVAATLPSGLIIGAEPETSLPSVNPVIPATQ